MRRIAAFVAQNGTGSPLGPHPRRAGCGASTVDGAAAPAASRRIRRTGLCDRPDTSGRKGIAAPRKSHGLRPPDPQPPDAPLGRLHPAIRQVTPIFHRLHSATRQAPDSGAADRQHTGHPPAISHPTAAARACRTLRPPRLQNRTARVRTEVRIRAVSPQRPFTWRRTACSRRAWTRG